MGFLEAGNYGAYRRLLAKAEPKPTDEQMDAWLREDVAHVREQAARRVRLNPELSHEMQLAGQFTMSITSGVGNDIAWPNDAHALNIIKKMVRVRHAAP
jgi:hypothetical protein